MTPPEEEEKAGPRHAKQAIGLLALKKRNEHQKKAQDAEAKRKKKNLGRTQILGKRKSSNDGIEDVEFEEVD